MIEDVARIGNMLVYDLDGGKEYRLLHDNFTFLQRESIQVSKLQMTAYASQRPLIAPNQRDTATFQQT